MSFEVNNLTTYREDALSVSFGLSVLEFSRIGRPVPSCPPETNFDQCEAIPMTQQTAISLDHAFVPAGTLSFQDLIDSISAQGSLFPTRQRDMISGLKRVAHALGLPPSDIPCDGRWLQPRLSKVSPALIGIQPKTWQNAVSNARAAMGVQGGTWRHSRRTWVCPPSPGAGHGCVQQAVLVDPFGAIGETAP